MTKKKAAQRRFSEFKHTIAHQAAIKPDLPPSSPALTAGDTP
jgi:hypothetical protein